MNGCGCWNEELFDEAGTWRPVAVMAAGEYLPVEVEAERIPPKPKSTALATFMFLFFSGAVPLGMAIVSSSSNV